MKKYHTIALVLTLAIISSCAKSKADLKISMEGPKWKVAKDLSYAYGKAGKRTDKLFLAQKGIEYGDACIEESPNEPACYYYHAINTGLFYQTKIIGYQNGLKSMIADCEKVLSINPGYDYGGAYRMLGLIYTEVPAVSLKSDSVKRDTEKAIDYLNKAIAMSPDFPENYIALAKAYLKADGQIEASKAVMTARGLLPKWQSHEDYPLWKKEIKKLAKILRKHINSLQLNT